MNTRQGRRKDPGDKAEQRVVQTATSHILPVALVGYRAWAIREDVLAAISGDYDWLPGEQESAFPCTSNRHGYHAYKNLDFCLEATREIRESYAVGAVLLWGTVVEHEGGYRAEHAQVVSIDYLGNVPLDEHNATLARLRGHYLSSI